MKCLIRLVNPDPGKGKASEMCNDEQTCGKQGVYTSPTYGNNTAHTTYDWSAAWVGAAHGSNAAHMDVICVSWLRALSY